MTEIAELVKNTNIFELAQKTNAKVALTDDERELTAELDANFKEIGKRGYDKDHEISQFLQKVVNTEIYEAPDEVLDMFFERGNVGEFDDVAYTVLPPENTLTAHLAAPGGNVEESYLDISELAPVWRNRQIETSVQFVELRRNGWKTVSLLAEYATQAFRNAMYADIFDVIDNAIASGATNYFTESTTAPTATSMDALATYIAERQEGDAAIVGLYKYVLAASKLQAASDAMLDERYKSGILTYYGGIPMKYFSSAKLVQGQLMFPDKRIFGVAGVIGHLDMKGEILTYQVDNPDREIERLLFKQFTYGYSIDPTLLKKVGKIVLA